MHVLAHRIDFRECFDHAIAEIVWVRTGKANATNAGNTPHGAEQIGKIGIPVVIGVHRLAEEYDFTHPISDDLLDLAYDVGKSPAALGAARVGHDTVGAPIIAAALDGDPRLD